MKKPLIGCVMVAYSLAVPALAHAQGAQKPVSGAVYVFVSPATTSLDAQGITAALKPATGKDTYQNDGLYPGVTVYAHFPRRFGADFALLTGTSETIDPEISGGYKGMNPLTGEHIILWDAGGTYSLCAGPRCGVIDLLLGVLVLNADPGPLTVPTNPAVGNFSPYVIDNEETTYYGFSIGVKGYYPLHPQFGIDYKLQYLPTYSVSGHYANAGDSTLSPEDVFRYRFGANYYVNQRWGVTVGYQGIKLDATLAQGPAKDSRAVVKNYGFYFGAMVNF